MEGSAGAQRVLPHEKRTKYYASRGTKNVVRSASFCVKNVFFFFFFFSRKRRFTYEDHFNRNFLSLCPAKPSPPFSFDEWPLSLSMLQLQVQRIRGLFRSSKITENQSGCYFFFLANICTTKEIILKRDEKLPILQTVVTLWKRVAWQSIWSRFKVRSFYFHWPAFVFFEESSFTSCKGWKSKSTFILENGKSDKTIFP